MKFVSKMRASGYGKVAISGILNSGITHYYRKVRCELEGGPRLNRRQDNLDIQKKRSKLGASECWYRRRRGGAEERHLKDQGWRGRVSSLPPTPPPHHQCPSCSSTGQGHTVPPPATTPFASVAPVVVPTIPAIHPIPVQPAQPQPKDRDVEATLMIPFTPNSALKNIMQKAEQSSRIFN